jgi:hypothetical protein
VLFWGAAVVGFALRVGKEGLEAGTKLVHVHSLPQFLCMPQISELVLYCWNGEGVMLLCWEIIIELLLMLGW